MIRLRKTGRQQDAYLHNRPKDSCRIHGIRLFVKDGISFLGKISLAQDFVHGTLYPKHFIFHKGQVIPYICLLYIILIPFLDLETKPQGVLLTSGRRSYANIDITIFNHLVSKDTFLLCECLGGGRSRFLVVFGFPGLGFVKGSCGWTLCHCNVCRTVFDICGIQNQICVSSKSSESQQTTHMESQQTFHICG
jgi:hypothetical protein